MATAGAKRRRRAPRKGEEKKEKEGEKTFLSMDNDRSRIQLVVNMTKNRIQKDQIFHFSVSPLVPSVAGRFREKRAPGKVQKYAFFAFRAGNLRVLKFHKKDRFAEIFPSAAMERSMFATGTLFVKISAWKP